MDYEKLYKKALERASKLRVQNPFDTVSQMMEYVFPELAESEDEKIREAIIATIHLYYGEPLEDEAKDMIAWLEKQGGRRNENRGSEGKRRGRRGAPLREVQR